MSEDDQSLPADAKLLSKTVIGPTQPAARFVDLRSAGRELAKALEQFRTREDVIVLGIALGGLLAAFEVAVRLSLHLDFIIIRRLLAPRGPGSQACAINVAGSLVIDDELVARPAAPESPFDYFVIDALDQLAGRERACRGGRPAIEIAQKSVIIVDCGIRSGLTMTAAIGAVRKKEPARIISAVPVASREGLAAVEAVSDEVFCLGLREPFGNVGVWYKDFSRPGDDEVSELLQQAAR